ncbi:restriction endonuclease [Paenibacillus rhizophilus]|nr:restriction endonuclease [Paenibacillus rhizophilus]
MEMKRTIEYRVGTNCYVDGCENQAEFEVYLYDYYENMNYEFFEQDFTCPFICKRHMKENEVRSQGEKKPRGIVDYPYTNRHGAQGYTKYFPISEVFPLLYASESKIFVPEFPILVSEVNDELLKFVAKNPSYLRKIEPRLFEEVVAEIFRRKGYEVHVTQRTRDGGLDIYAIKHEIAGAMHFVIECKRYAESRKVGIEKVQRLNGIIDPNRGHRGVLVTTSSFSSDAIKFAQPLEHRISLRDFSDLQNWLAEYNT